VGIDFRRRSWPAVLGQPEALGLRTAARTLLPSLWFLLGALRLSRLHARDPALRAPHTKKQCSTMEAGWYRGPSVHNRGLTSD